jgi:hypothetical protein
MVLFISDKLHYVLYGVWWIDLSGLLLAFLLILKLCHEEDYAFWHGRIVWKI